MTSAFVYLATCSMRNSIRMRLRRLREPRYLLIALGMLIYLASILFNRPPTGYLVINPALHPNAEAIGAGVALLVLLLIWLFSGGAALRFTLPEVQFLFPAPISRRQLIGYKLSRLLTTAFSTTLVLTLFAGPKRAVPAASFIGRTFVVMAMLAFFEAAVSLHKQSVKDDNRLKGAARLRTLVTGGAVTLWLAWVMARVALAPAEDVTRMLPLALVTLAINAAWVLRSNAAFEEAAAEAAAAIGRAEIRAGALPRLRRSTAYRLAPSGPIESAILWKNWMLIGRRSRLQMIAAATAFFGIVIGTVFFSTIVFESDVVPSVCFAVVGFVVLLGPLMLRIDLRQDLTHLAVFKTWPVRGAAIIRGEVLAPLIALSIILPIPLVVGAASDRRLIFGPGTVASARLAFAAVTLLGASAIILAQLIIQNGIAVTFPAWIRINPAGGTAGIEMMGQMMITQYGGVLVLALALIPPCAGAACLWFLLGGEWTWGALVVPSVAFTILTAIECLLAIEWLGGILERADLRDVAVTE